MIWFDLKSLEFTNSKGKSYLKNPFKIFFLNDFLWSTDVTATSWIRTSVFVDQNPQSKTLGRRNIFSIGARVTKRTSEGSRLAQIRVPDVVVTDSTAPQALAEVKKEEKKSIHLWGSCRRCGRNSPKVRVYFSF